jgi:chromosome segregation ATPase
MTGNGGGPAAADGPEAALAGLGRAITRAAGALAEPPGDDATAYRCARALDAAFGELTALLRTVPEIVGLGDPGRVVSERIEQCRSELASRGDEAAAYRQRLDDLEESERDLAGVTAEAGRLRAQIGELDRAQRLATEIPALRARVAALTEAVAAADAADAPEVSARIAAAAGQLAALTARQREAIGEEAGQLAATAEKAAAELEELRGRRDATVAELAQRESEAAQLDDACRETLPTLTAWRQADADLAGGLAAVGLEADASALETVMTELDGIRERLGRLDDALRSLLAEHASAYEQARQVRPL